MMLRHFRDLMEDQGCGFPPVGGYGYALGNGKECASRCFTRAFSTRVMPQGRCATTTRSVATSGDEGEGARRSLPAVRSSGVGHRPETISLGLPSLMRSDEHSKLSASRDLCYARQVDPVPRGATQEE